MATRSVKEELGDELIGVAVDDYAGAGELMTERDLLMFDAVFGDGAGITEGEVHTVGGNQQVDVLRVYFLLSGYRFARAFPSPSHIPLPGFRRHPPRNKTKTTRLLRRLHGARARAARSRQHLSGLLLLRSAAASLSSGEGRVTSMVRQPRPAW